MNIEVSPTLHDMTQGKTPPAKHIYIHDAHIRLLRQGPAKHQGTTWTLTGDYIKAGGIVWKINWTPRPGPYGEIFYQATWPD